MKSYYILVIALLLIISGCSKAGPSCAHPSIPVGDGCCLDMNRNGVCDRDEGNANAEQTAGESETIAVITNEVKPVKGEVLAKPSSPLAPTPTAMPVIGTGGKETMDTSDWESIRLYYRDTIERCGKKIDFVSADSSAAAGDSITLQIGTPRETIAKGDIGFVMESSGLDYVVQNFGILTGSNEGMSFVSLKIHCK